MAKISYVGETIKTCKETSDESKAFKEYILKRCDEIITSDEYCAEINHEILKLEQKLLPLLSHEALSIFLKIDELNMKLTDHISTLLYR